MGSLLIGLVGFWLIFLIILPQLSMLDYSFRYNLPPSQVGGPDDVYTLSNYQYLLYGSDSSTRLIMWSILGSLCARSSLQSL